MNADRVMDNIRNAFERSGITLNELGQGLGYDGPTATKRAWSLLYRTSDPRISTVLARIIHDRQDGRCREFWLMPCALLARSFPFPQKL